MVFIVNLKKVKALRNEQNILNNDGRLRKSGKHAYR